MGDTLCSSRHKPLDGNVVIKIIVAFDTQRLENYSICLSRQKILATIFVMKNSKIFKRQTELNNMLVKKGALND